MPKNLKYYCMTFQKQKNLQSFFVREKLTVIYCFHRKNPFYLKHQKIKKEIDAYFELNVEYFSKEESKDSKQQLYEPKMASETPASLVGCGPNSIPIGTCLAEALEKDPAFAATLLPMLDKCVKEGKKEALVSTLTDLADEGKFVRYFKTHYGRCYIQTHK